MAGSGMNMGSGIYIRYIWLMMQQIYTSLGMPPGLGQRRRDSFYTSRYGILIVVVPPGRDLWRDGRVAEGARLESVYTARYPGFESLSLRHSPFLKTSYKVETK